MVGVPGRSKACNTCRKRKKGCDLQRPVCGQCRKACIECMGYSREFLFVNGTVQKSPRKPSRVATVALQDSLAHSAYEDKYLGIFWETYLPNGRVLSGDAVWATGGGWTNVIRDFYPSDGILKKAFLAICLATIGKRDGQPWMSEQSLRLYAAAMQEMSVVLRVPSKAKSDAVLTATKLFSLYEAMYGADDTGRVAQTKSWLTHNSGETAIVATRTPDQYASGRAHRLFIDGRFHLTVSALIVRKKIIFSDPEWKTLPWRHQPKTHKDTLMDIFVDMPGWLEDIDSMLACDDAELQDAQRRNLIDRCWLFDEQLTEWYAVVQPPQSLDQLDCGSYSSIKTNDLSAIHLTTLHWAICLVLYMTMSSVVVPGLRLPERANPRTYCRNIARTVSIFLHPAVGIFRMHLVTFPIGVALRYLAGLEPGDMDAERELLYSCLKRSEGAMVGKFVINMEVDILQDQGS